VKEVAKTAIASKVFTVFGVSYSPKGDARVLEKAARWLKKKEIQEHTILDMVFSWRPEDKDVPERAILTIYYTET
jgi:hypothetical protein